MGSCFACANVVIKLCAYAVRVPTCSRVLVLPKIAVWFPPPGYLHNVDPLSVLGHSYVVQTNKLAKFRAR